jgi:hypothetical protein
LDEAEEARDLKKNKVGDALKSQKPEAQVVVVEHVVFWFR